MQISVSNQQSRTFVCYIGTFNNGGFHNNNKNELQRKMWGVIWIILITNKLIKPPTFEKEWQRGLRENGISLNALELLMVNMLPCRRLVPRVPCTAITKEVIVLLSWQWWIQTTSLCWLIYEMSVNKVIKESFLYSP